MPGLSISDVVNVQINLSPLAVPLRNFGALCIAGSSPVIDVVERIRLYATLDGVAEDFGIAAPEYLAADLFFAQSPQPAMLYIGRFAETATMARLRGAVFLPTQQPTLLADLQAISDGTMTITISGLAQDLAASGARLRGAGFLDTVQDALLADLQAISDGTMTIPINGTDKAMTALDFSGIDTLDDAAEVIAGGLTPALATCVWSGSDFVVTTTLTGGASSISYAKPEGSGADVSATLGLTQASGAQPPQPGRLGLDFTGIVTLNGAASVVQSALIGASCTWDGERFQIASTIGGPSATISYASPQGTGTDVSGIMGLTQASGASVPIAGIAPESPLACAVALRAHPEWYGLVFATATPVADADHVAVANFIEGASPSSLYGITTQDPRELDSSVDIKLSSTLGLMALRRTFMQFCSSSPYAAASTYGRAFTVDFEANNSVITLKFKQNPGITAELLTEDQAEELRFNHVNVFAAYTNAAAIIQEGAMINGFFFDEVHGTDWLANRVQTDVFNLLYGALKVPQTNQGVHLIVTVVENALAAGVDNGLIAPGQWNAPGFGQIAYGQMLPKGYYVYAPLLETQPQSIREQRIAPTIQAAIKLAGAVHFANVIINVNR